MAKELVLKFRHQRVAYMVTESVVMYFKRRGYEVLRDDARHIAIGLVDRTPLSVFCSGFEERLDVQKLTKGSNVNHRYHERCYSKPAKLLPYVKALNAKLSRSKQGVV